MKEKFVLAIKWLGIIMIVALIQPVMVDVYTLLKSNINSVSDETKLTITNFPSRLLHVAQTSGKFYFDSIVLLWLTYFIFKLTRKAFKDVFGARSLVIPGFPFSTFSTHIVVYGFAYIFSNCVAFLFLGDFEYVDLPIENQFQAIVYFLILLVSAPTLVRFMGEEMLKFRVLPVTESLVNEGEGDDE